RRGSPSAGQLVQLPFGPVALVAIAGLQLPDELVPLAGGLVQVVVGQVAPLLLDLALELLPVAFDSVPVHGSPPPRIRGRGLQGPPGPGEVRWLTPHQGARRVASSILRPAASAGPLGGLTVSRISRAAWSTCLPARSAGPSLQPTPTRGW